MKFEIKVQVTTPDGDQQEHLVTILEKGLDCASNIGLSIAESKDLLFKLQQQIVNAQTEAFSAEKSHCSCCNKKLRSKGYKSIRYRTLFGDIELNSPRFYHCTCQKSKAVTFSPLTSLLQEHVAPEMLWLETKWASLVSFGASVDLLKDILPIGDGLSAETVRRHLAKMAQRMENELADEQDNFAYPARKICPHLSNPDGPIVVGIDGGYVRSRDKGQGHFEVTVGKSLPTDHADRYIGLVQSYDNKPKRRLHELLKEQGWQENQAVTFLTDGADSLVKLANDMSPAAEHLLDWFHITMRITVMGQYIKGLSKIDPEKGELLARHLRRIKGFLWNGNTYEAQHIIDEFVEELDYCEVPYQSLKALQKAAREFQVYIANNKKRIPNYAERRRYGERVSTGFVESTVNTVVGKRFCKRQQMRWSKRGAHYMLQTRPRTLDGTLRHKFEQWYPGMEANDQVRLAA